MVESLLETTMQPDETAAIPEDLKVSLAAAQQANFALSALGVVAALVFRLGGATLHLPSAVVLALLPGVLIYLVQHEPMLYAIAKPNRRDPRTDLTFGFMACGIGLILGIGDIHFAETQTLLKCAGLVGALCCAVIFTAARNNPGFWSTMLGALFFAGVYGWGLVAAADIVPDRSAPAYYTTTVINKFESYHRGTHYNLVLAPWGPIEEPKDLTVSDEIYDGALVGGQVCLALHPGLLYVEWYRIVSCDNTGQR